MTDNMEELIYTLDTVEEAINGADILSEQLGFLLDREEETTRVLGKEGYRFLEGYKIHLDNGCIALNDIKDDLMQRIKNKRKWDN